MPVSKYINAYEEKKKKKWTYLVIMPKWQC